MVHVFKDKVIGVTIHAHFIHCDDVWVMELHQNLSLTNKFIQGLLAFVFQSLS